MPKRNYFFIYRDNPLRIWYEGQGIRVPPRSHEPRLRIWWFASELTAKQLTKTLNQRAPSDRATYASSRRLSTILRGGKPSVASQQTIDDL